jgi:hypothetical protein
MPTDQNDFGSDRYTFLNGQRYLIKRIRTVKPGQGERTCDFEDRMYRFAERLGTRPHVTNVQVDIQYQKNQATICTFDVTYEPHIPDAAVNETPAGGRHTGGRGSRAA